VHVSTPTNRMTTRARAVLLAGGAVLAAATLGACAGTPGAAAVVDGHAISTSQVQAAADQLVELGQQIDVPSVLTLLIQEPTITRLAQERGMGVSDSQARELLDQVSQTVGASVGEYAEGTLAVARYSIAVNGFNADEEGEAIAEEVEEALAALDIDVNPRFGELGPSASVAGAAPRAWIVTPQADAS